MKKLISILIIAMAIPAMSQTHKFKALPYAYDGLEPYIDAQTMELHYDKHHRGYYNKFIAAIDDNDELTSSSMPDIFANISEYGPAIRNNGGGYWNHEFFWESMIPGGAGLPDGDFKNKITEDFGSLENFLAEFKNAGLSRFGSGWVWLIVQRGDLLITSTANQDNPLMNTAEAVGTPLLALDVWEHAYYLKYQNKRGDYIDNFFKVINWIKVSERYYAATK